MRPAKEMRHLDARWLDVIERFAERNRMSAFQFQGSARWNGLFSLRLPNSQLASLETMHILVIEDSAEDAFLILQAITTADCQAFVCRKISEAKAYLEGSGLFFDRRKFPFPDAVIADLDICGESGLEFIRWLRGHVQFERLPTFVLSGSLSKEALSEAQELGVSRVMQKPQDFRMLERTLAQLTSELMSRM